MTILDHPSRSAGELLDTDAMLAELGRLAVDFSGRERELRIAVAQRLKAAHADARIVAEQLLLEDRNGRRCAERLCRLQDDIIMVLYDFVAKHLYPSQSPSDAEHMAVVSAIINLARALGIFVVAEGVETEEQAQRLKTLGCDEAQGFLFGRPQPAEEIAKLLPGA